MGYVDKITIELENYPEIYAETLQAARDEKERNVILLKSAQSNMSHNNTIRRLYTIQISVEIIIFAAFCYLILDKL